VGVYTEYDDTGRPVADSAAQIWFMEIDHTKDPDFNKITGLELTAAAVDEVNDIMEEATTSSALVSAARTATRSLSSF
jgi:hypothetical protein